MTEHATWFGSPGRPLFGWLYLPERAAAGVVLCPPIGREELIVHPSLRLLAERLAAEQVAALRFDYTGTGDSSGDPDALPGIGTWIDDVREAVAALRRAGVPRVVLLGMRTGALLAARAARRVDVAGLVLWDPCETGQQFLREQRFLCPEPAELPGLREIQGMLLPDRLASDLARMRLDDDDSSLDGELLVLARRGRRLGAALEPRLGGARAEVHAAPGLSELRNQDQIWSPSVGLDRFPWETIALVAGWCRDRVATGSPVPTVAPPAREEALVVPDAGEGGVVERTVRIGPGKMFGILALPAPPAEGPAPTVCFLNLACEPHTGPSRLWVELSRRWAARGVRALRLDVTGIGDSPLLPGQRLDMAFPAEAIGDVLAATRFLCPDDPAGVVLVGVCSGAYHALEGAARLGSRRIWLVNLLVPPSVLLPERGEAAGGDRRQAVRRVGTRTLRLATNDRAVRLVHRFVPSAGWWAADRLGLYSYPLRVFEPVITRGTDVRLVCGQLECWQFLGRGEGLLRRLARSGRFHLEIVPSIDHSLIRAASRTLLRDHLTSYLDDALSAARAGSDAAALA